MPKRRNGNSEIENSTLTHPLIFRYIYNHFCRRGGRAWLNAHDSKSCVPQGTGGSNPSLSAIFFTSRSAMLLQHIIWDWNGTLLDDTQAGVNAVNAMLAARGLPTIDVTVYRDVFGFPVKDFYRAIGFKLEGEDWDAMAREFHARFLADTSIRLHAHTTQILTCLRQNGIRHSVLSASEQSILDRMVSAYHIAHFFDGIFGVDNLYGQSKLALGQVLLRRLGLQTENVLMIGDSLHDHEVAEALGVPCLLIAQGHQSYARLARSGCPVIGSLDEVTAWLKITTP